MHHAAAARHQAPATIHTNLTRPIAARRVIAHDPPIVVALDVVADGIVELRGDRVRIEQFAAVGLGALKAVDNICPGAICVHGKINKQITNKIIVHLFRNTGSIELACPHEWHTGLNAIASA